MSALEKDQLAGPRAASGPCADNAAMESPFALLRYGAHVSNWNGGPAVGSRRRSIVRLLA